MSITAQITDGDTGETTIVPVSLSVVDMSKSYRNYELSLTFAGFEFSAIIGRVGTITQNGANAAFAALLSTLSNCKDLVQHVALYEVEYEADHRGTIRQTLAELKPTD